MEPSASRVRIQIMHKITSRVIEWTVTIDATLFIAVLFISAYWEPDIRWLHFFQAWMYLAAIWLSVRRSRWGYFIGLSAAGLWDYINIFVTTFFRSGLHWRFAWIGTGQLKHVDQRLRARGSRPCLRCDARADY